MVGGRVCHAHGGRAPQVRNGAVRRKQYAMAWGMLRRIQADNDTQRAAMEPWAGELSQMRWDGVVRLQDPEVLARRARGLARCMSRTAQDLRDYARVLTSSDEEKSEP